MMELLSEMATVIFAGERVSVFRPWLVLASNPLLESRWEGHSTQVISACDATRDHKLNSRLQQA